MVHSLSLINLYVSDVAVSRHFYCQVLGIPVASNGAPDEDKYLPLDLDGPQIYLHWTPPGSLVEYRKRGIELYLRVEDADAMARRLGQLGVALKTPVYDVGWRPWCCLAIEDPDGYTLYLVSRQKDARADPDHKP
jgi:predicted enzyme related to lactoylglutathione lyase